MKNGILSLGNGTLTNKNTRFYRKIIKNCRSISFMADRLFSGKSLSATQWIICLLIAKYKGIFMRYNIKTLFRRNIKTLFRRTLNYIEIKLKRSRLISKPLFVGIEPTLQCNSNCIMCNRQFNRKEDKLANGFLSWDTFNKVKPFFKYAEAVCFGGFGESLLHPDYLPMLYMKLKKKLRLYPFILMVFY